MEDIWSHFRLDPRDPANAGMRASDADRDVVRTVLDEAYADGRLTRDEHDERVDSTLAAQTLGDLPPLVRDLVHTTEVAVRPSGALSPVDIRAKAVAGYRAERRDALMGFVGPSLICLVIWAIVMPGGFFWPAFVMLGTGINLLQTVVRREDIVEKKVEKLERKQAKELGQRADPEDPEESG